MVIVQERIPVEEIGRESEGAPDGVGAETRSRDGRGHCWDGLHCDHPEHGVQGTIHFIR